MVVPALYTDSPVRESSRAMSSVSRSLVHSWTRRPADVTASAPHRRVWNKKLGYKLYIIRWKVVASWSERVRNVWLVEMSLSIVRHLVHFKWAEEKLRLSSWMLISVPLLISVGLIVQNCTLSMVHHFQNCRWKVLKEIVNPQSVSLSRLIPITFSFVLASNYFDQGLEC